MVNFLTGCCRYIILWLLKKKILELLEILEMFLEYWGYMEYGIIGIGL